ncbi:GntR family transcriptional regulator [Alkalihalobacillus alcalophilus ATCC 27647 = CGMCC 1.3604]|uniref:GntR family transcriptional regulator n=1 Tax=Alkalihalobacillus alcalophilus ATCC 27647 = CGMCC 1.3604 TaxID=1218173 RepID=A0A094WJH1_ALKAL|nr:PLP-dependent aminotransferase family protein [Alkalihalobacillus alcalophilus]KGA96986.1 GntR family transcriptional regulator [Alkalihalobacillus alcalophilus ATCC 27647 = CGMCC 1.3604]MED1564212.1 PLP-dependent aminotransferase family protein [Alkalihalobacillus alcalophilus]THG90281.1 GntR family transcriptional regulator [Alkalihalobacillus alcalophilus ATCC 27647 = CGMCC 1.3604]
MDWKPDRMLSKPIYKQISSYFEEMISKGVYPANEMLPSERTLATQLQVNRSTIKSAYEELEALGIVERVKGSGTKVSSNIWGISHKRIPNWGRYVEDGSFLPNIPMVQKIRTITQEPNIVNLASGELSPHLMPTEAIREIISTQPFSENLGYDHPQGNEELREALASFVHKYRCIKTDSESILITSGAQQAIHLIVECLLKPGDAIAIENPSYSYSLPLFKTAGIRTYLLSVDEQGANPEELISLHKKHRIRMVFLNPSYQNPTGTSLSTVRRERFLALSSELGIPIIEDDPYGITSYSGKMNPALKSLDKDGNVLYISSLSKVVSSGLRIGWVIGPQAVIQRLADAKQQIDFGHSIFPQWVAKTFLNSTYIEEHIKSLRVELSQRRDELDVSLRNFLADKISYHLPEGGIHLWCKLNQRMNENKLIEESIKNGVAFVPGKILGNMEESYVRFTYGREDLGRISEGIYRFSETIKRLEYEYKQTNRK